MQTRLHKRLLDDVFGILLIARNPQRKSQDPISIAFVDIAYGGNGHRPGPYTVPACQRATACLLWLYTENEF